MVFLQSPVILDRAFCILDTTQNNYLRGQYYYEKYYFKFY